MDAWSYFVEDNDGDSPENVFQLINYSRTSDKISTLSYNKALIIFEKHTMDNKQTKKNKKSSSSSSKKKNKNKNKDQNGLISLSITSPTSPSGQPSALTINSSDSDSNNIIPKHKTKKKKKDKGTKKLSSKKKSASTHNLMSLTETTPKKSSSKKKKKNGTHKSQSRPSSPTTPSDNEEYNLNDHVLLNKDREGIIKFIGNVHFTKGTLYGIELLHGSMGKHDGMIENERYFQTEPKRGIFVKKKQIRRRIRAKDMKSSSRLRRTESIEQQKRSSSINKMMNAKDIKMVHGDIDIGENVLLQAKEIEKPSTKKRKSKKKRNKSRESPQHRRRSSSAKRASRKQGTVKINQDKMDKLIQKKSRTVTNASNNNKKSIDDKDVFTKIMINMDDNSDWDDVDDDEREDDEMGLSMNRTPEPKKSRHHTAGNKRNSKKLKKRQSVDDMIIDDYFANKDEDKSTPQSVNRVHSRIPDRRYHRKTAAATSAKVPASFKKFREQKQSRSNTIANRNGNNGAIIQKRRSRDHLFYTKTRDKNGNKHNKHKSVHILPKSNGKTFNLGVNIDDSLYVSSGDEYEDEDEVKEMVNNASKRMEFNNNGIRRGSLDDSSPTYKKHTKGAKSMQDFGSIRSMVSAPAGFGNDIDDSKSTESHKKDKHSRFSSVTNGISKAWKFAKAKGEQQKKKKKLQKSKNGNKSNKKKNAIFGIDPKELNSTLLLETDYESPIPNILIKLRSELFQNDGHLIEGIFRKAPNATKCKEIEDQLNDGKFLQINFSEIECILIANLIKIWFRQLPIPILQLIDSSKIEKVQITQNISDVIDIINNDLKEPYKSYFKWLLDLCLDIAKYENENKMGIKNMAVVVSPNLYDPTKIENPMKAMTVSQAIVHFLQLSMQWRSKEQKEQQD